MASSSVANSPLPTSGLSSVSEAPREVMAPWREAGLAGLIQLAAAYQRDPVQAFAWVRRRYGPTAFFARPRNDVRVIRPMIVTTDPALLRKLLTDPRFRNSSLTLSGPRGSAHRRLRHSIFRMHGEEHRRNRRLLTPAMQKKSVEGLHQTMVDVARGVLAPYRPGETRDLAADMKAIARQIAAASLFGLTDLSESEALGHRVEDWLSDSFKLQARLLPYDVPGSAYRAMLNKAVQLERVGLELIERRRRDGAAGSDLLSHLVRRQRDSGDLTEAELLGHIHILFLAAHETTSHALSWTLLLLGQHPEVFAQASEEVHAQLSGEAPSPADLGKLAVLERIIDESLRLFPIVPFGARIASEDLEIAGRAIARKTRVLMPFVTAHHDPEIFPEPQRFNPDRWLSSDPPPYTYLPFSAGLHMCIGVPFAKLLKRASYQLPDPIRVDRHTTITMSPKQGVPAKIQAPHQPPRRVQVVGSASDLFDATEQAT
jgi:cytochrome P450